MSFETEIAVLFNDLRPESVNRSIPLLFSEISKASAVLFYRIHGPPSENGIDLSQLSLAGHEHASESLLRLYKIGQSNAFSVTKTLQISSIADMFDSQATPTPHDRHITLEFGYRSVVSVPLMGKTSLLGLAVLFYIPVQTFNEENLSNISVWSRYCGMALEQSQLIEKVSAMPLFSGEESAETMEEDAEMQRGQLGLLAASISHEVNNSLDGIKNYLYLISSETAEDHPHKEYLKIVETEIARTGQIVKQLSDLYQPGKTPKSSLQINEIIQSAVQLVDHQSKGKNYKFTLDLGKGLAPINGVPEQLKSVFLNLFLNAVQAMPQGGEIKVKTELQGEPKKIKITISDNGPGIPREHLSHVFQPFYTTKKGGTGLGLTICRQIIKSHEGTITVESLPEKGTQFIISLPLGE